MNKDINNYLLLNDLSIDREANRKKVVPIPNTKWTIDNRGTVRGLHGTEVSYDACWDGSLRVRPSVNGKQVWMYVNQLVLHLFGNERPTDKHVPWHRDGDRTNNRVDNLSWVVMKKERETND